MNWHHSTCMYRHSFYLGRIPQSLHTRSTSFVNCGTCFTLMSWRSRPDCVLYFMLFSPHMLMFFFLKAFDRILDQMKEADFPFSKVKGISGAGQQHGSVYWRQGALQVLKHLRPETTLQAQLSECFSISQSPIWMDSSTTTQCKQMDEAVGGPSEMASITGSRCYERFTGSQILKIIQQQSDAYKNTEVRWRRQRIELNWLVLPDGRGSFRAIEVHSTLQLEANNIEVKHFEPGSFYCLIFYIFSYFSWYRGFPWWAVLPLPCYSELMLQ